MEAIEKDSLDRREGVGQLNQVLRHSQNCQNMEAVEKGSLGRREGVGQGERLNQRMLGMTRIRARFPVALKAVLAEAVVKTVKSAVTVAVAVESKRRFSNS